MIRGWSVSVAVFIELLRLLCGSRLGTRNIKLLYPQIDMQCIRMWCVRSNARLIHVFQTGIWIIWTICAHTHALA